MRSPAPIRDLLVAASAKEIPDESAARLSGMTSVWYGAFMAMTVTALLVASPAAILALGAAAAVAVTLVVVVVVAVSVARSRRLRDDERG